MRPAEESGFRSLPRRARVYILAVLAAGAGALAAATVLTPGPPLDLPLLLVVAALCAAGNLFAVLAPSHYHYSFEPSAIFFFFGVVLLPPWAAAALAFLCFVPASLVQRTPWFKDAFNVAAYLLPGLAAYEVVHVTGALAAATSEVTTVAALLAASGVFVALNHLLLVFAVGFAGERPLRKSLREFADGLPLDGALALTGACIAALWSTSPPLVALAAGPMIAIYRALWIPMLTHKARTDPKTGLFNFEHFSSEFTSALSEAEKAGADLAVVMFDLDHLRAVNNRCGHLAGDRLIRAVAETLSELAGRAGVAGRFGGEEFALLLPETSLTRACEIAEDVRSRVEEMRLRSDDGLADLRVTISAGIAAYPEHGDSMNGLLSAADAALYDAKLGGRNRVRVALPPGTREALDIAAGVQAAAGAPSLPAHGVGPGSAVLDAARPLTVSEPDITELGLGDETRLDPDLAVADPDVGPLIAAVATPDEVAPAAAGEEPAGPNRHLIPWLAAALAGLAVLIGAVSSPARIFEAPELFALLIVSVIVLDTIRLDIFERANVSPASVPGLALACLFGPFGLIASEAVILALLVIKREPFVRALFDFGALALAGASAAVVYAAIDPRGAAAVLVVGGLCGLVYYAVNVSLLAVVMGLAEGKGPRVAWREGLAWLWPHYLSFGLLAGMFVVSEREVGLYVFGLFAIPIGMLWVSQRQYLERSRTSVTELRRSHSELEAANKRLRGLLMDNQDLLTRMHRSYLSTITSLARTIEAKDPYTGGHTERVARIAHMLAEELGFDTAQLRAINVGAVIHDIGKIGIPDEILLKRGTLSTPEFAEMRRHPEIASYILADLELPAIVKQMVRSHHERYDGSGYPDGLTGEEIPLPARILTVADAVDAMTSDRPYRDALPLPVARAEIRAQAGLQFCPRVVAALEVCLERDPSVWDEHQLVA